MDCGGTRLVAGYIRELEHILKECVGGQLVIPKILQRRSLVILLVRGTHVQASRDLRP